jgi:serine/threonine protein kinase
MNLIAHKYHILEKISEGAFGQVFKGINIRTHELVAIKCESKSNPAKSLKNEAKVYQYLGHSDGFPRMKTFVSLNDMNYLVMDLLDTTVDKCLISENRDLLVIGIQMIQRIQSLHEKSLLHRDIKPSNFMVDAFNKVYLVDFGFVKRYNYDGVHIPESQIRNIIGSINFVSINVHNFIEPSRRDDLESCIYIILSLIIQLPWHNKRDIQEIIQQKANIIHSTPIPTFIKTMITYVRSIGFSEEPNYGHLINILQLSLDN